MTEGEVSGIDMRGEPMRLVHSGGVIQSVERGGGMASARWLILPAFANAHDHARPVPASSFGSMFLPLEAWLPRSVLGTPPDPYISALPPLARVARAGCAVAMVHYTRASGTMPIPDEAAEVVRAARDIGLRIAFALAVRDQNPLVYGDGSGVLAELPADARDEISRLFLPPPPTPQGYLALVDEIARRIEGDSVSVQYGPAGVQWCSRPMLKAIAEASARTGRRVHMHLLETRYQRAWADREFPGGMVRWLRDIGLLSPRLSVAHATWARPDELDLIAESGTVIVTNLSSNMHVKSGLAPIAEAVRRGCRIAVGVDGLALDEDDDMVRELRLVHGLHAGYGFDETWTRTGFLEGAVAAGRTATGAPGTGAFAPGEPADFVVVDVDALDRDRLMPVDAFDLFFARGNRSFIREVVVAGRTTYADGRLTGVDLHAAEKELRARLRANIAEMNRFHAAWPSYHAAVRTWMTERCGCC